MDTLENDVDALRETLRAATRQAEPNAVLGLINAARLTPPRLKAARATARELIEQLRERRGKSGGVDALMQQFSLSSEEGVALMCLAEALLRIPDRATADALIRDKVSRGDWRAHLGKSSSVFVNAAAWGLMVTGKLVSTHSEEGLGAAVTQLLAKGGEPLIRKGVDLAMRLLGQQFVMGETIDLALQRAREPESRGYRYSYDMLGEAALTADDARRYFAAYQTAIDAIGHAADGRGIEAGPGISVKLSALHPRYVRAQRQRVLDEMLPRLRSLCIQARQFDIGLAIDAEESERLDLSLDLIAALARDPQLAGWDGLGVVVQAYQKRCPFVIDWLAALARNNGRRLMVRLVKGAYWDSEVKRAQVEGQSDYPVFTRKLHTDVSYLACARRLLRHADVFLPQFATHNAMTLAMVIEMAREAGVTRYEFQCLHGMGESLYDRVIGDDGLGLPCRIYAPVGTHETLLAYLVRRLLENGANSSFVNRIVDPAVSIDELLADPVAAAERSEGQPHPRIALPAHLFAGRRNSSGLDLNDEQTLQRLQQRFDEFAQRRYLAVPVQPTDAPLSLIDIRNPARHDHVVGQMRPANGAQIGAAVAASQAAARVWGRTTPGDRAAALERAADLLEAHRDELMWLAIHEAGKTLGNALGEVREAVDFCRYYAQQIRLPDFGAGSAPLGVIVCISPWNFPLAIFTGQVAAALAAGNTVLAKPAEQTPLIAARAVELLHEAGIPPAALQLLAGAGEVGAALTAHADVAGVVFTGSTEVAQKIDRTLAQRAGATELVLIAETGGQNAMLVDSSSLPEQVVIDALMSAFDSAGQRCSALRLLCLQEEIADHTLAMLQGALQELSIGDPALLTTDVGPVIDRDAQQSIEAHVAQMAPQHRVTRLALPSEAQRGTFVAPTIIEIDRVSRLRREVFGPVLHVLRYRREQLVELIDQINATGYALTFGIHSRIDETIDAAYARSRAGNTYVNRNIIGAVVGVQPFGGECMSGTGPKAGGPLYLPRLRRNDAAKTACGAITAATPPVTGHPNHRVQSTNALAGLQRWAAANAMPQLAEACAAAAARSPLDTRIDMPGPTGERNLWSLVPRGIALCAGTDDETWLTQIVAALATGNTPLLPAAARPLLARLPADVSAALRLTSDALPACEIALAPRNAAASLRKSLAERSGARTRVVEPDADGSYPLTSLLVERSLTINTTAAGGNASLMTLQAE